MMTGRRDLIRSMVLCGLALGLGAHRVRGGAPVRPPSADDFLGRTPEQIRRRLGSASTTLVTASGPVPGGWPRRMRTRRTVDGRTTVTWHARRAGGRWRPSATFEGAGEHGFVYLRAAPDDVQPIAGLRFRGGRCVDVSPCLWSDLRDLPDLS